MNTILPNVKSMRYLIAIFSLILAPGYAVSADSMTLKVARSSTFISPYTPELVIGSDDKRQAKYCFELPAGKKCPPILLNHGTAGIPAIQSAFKANLPNARISFVVEEINHEIVANGGVGSGFAGTEVSVDWLAQIPQADVVGFDHINSSVIPGPGNTATESLFIYDGLMFDGCENFQPLSIGHSAQVFTSGEEVGSFNGTDNTTVDSTGFYNFHYIVNAVDGSKESNIIFSGKLNVTCSGLNSL